MKAAKILAKSTIMWSLAPERRIRKKEKSRFKTFCDDSQSDDVIMSSTMLLTLFGKKIQEV